MECGRFLEEKLGGTPGPAFREHLAECEGCRRDLGEYEEIRRLYRLASVERYPGAVPRPRRFGSSSWLSAAAAAVLLGVLVLVLFGGPAETPRPAGVEAFVRVHLEPWNPQDAALNRMADDIWEVVLAMERRGR